MARSKFARQWPLLWAVGAALLATTALCGEQASMSGAAFRARPISAQAAVQRPSLAGVSTAGVDMGAPATYRDTTDAFGAQLIPQQVYGAGQALAQFAAMPFTQPQQPQPQQQQQQQPIAQQQQAMGAAKPGAASLPPQQPQGMAPATAATTAYPGAGYGGYQTPYAPHKPYGGQYQQPYSPSSGQYQQPYYQDPYAYAPSQAPQYGYYPAAPPPKNDAPGYDYTDYKKDDYYKPHDEYTKKDDGGYRKDGYGPYKGYPSPVPKNTGICQSSTYGAFYTQTVTFDNITHPDELAGGAYAFVGCKDRTTLGGECSYTCYDLNHYERFVGTATRIVASPPQDWDNVDAERHPVYCYWDFGGVLDTIGGRSTGGPGGSSSPSSGAKQRAPRSGAAGALRDDPPFFDCDFTIRVECCDDVVPLVPAGPEYDLGADTGGDCTGKVGGRCGSNGNKGGAGAGGNSRQGQQQRGAGGAGGKIRRKLARGVGAQAEGEAASLAALKASPGFTAIKHDKVSGGFMGLREQQWEADADAPAVAASAPGAAEPEADAASRGSAGELEAAAEQEAAADAQAAAAEEQQLQAQQPEQQQAPPQQVLQVPEEQLQQQMPRRTPAPRVRGRVSLGQSIVDVQQAQPAP